MKIYLLLITNVFICHSLICQSNHVIIDVQSNAHVIELPAISSYLTNSDTCLTCLKPYGKKYIVDADLDKWYKSKNDSMNLYSLKIKAIGAVFLDIIFDNFYIPEGCKLSLSSDKYHFVYTYKNSEILNITSKALSISGEEVNVNYWVPDSVKLNNRLISISSITYVYDQEFSEATEQLNSSRQLDCHNDVNCSDGDPYREIIRSIVLIRNLCDDNGNCSRCSGSVLNNTSGDYTPYILTAHHCVQGEIEDNLDEAIFSFNYQRKTCDGDVPYGYFSNPYTITGAELKAQRTAVMGSDFALLELNQMPPIHYNIYYSGWSREWNLTGSDVECIHHPLGEPKKISFGHIKGISLGDYLNAEWDDGTVENGSSGSPLFKIKRVVGNYSANWGGDNSCDDLGDGLFGHFASSWGSTWGPGRRLRDWLDPSDDDPDNLDGSDPRNDCNSTLNLSGVYFRTDYQNETVVLQASNSVNFSHLDIQPHGNYEFKAGNSIIITANTSIIAGSNVAFLISPCSPTFKSESISEQSAYNNDLLCKEVKDEKLLMNNPSIARYNHIKVFPNPSNGVFNIIIEPGKHSIFELELFNSMGNRLQVLRNSDHHIVLDLTNLAEGVYLLKINFGENYFCERLIKR